MTILNVDFLKLRRKLSFMLANQGSCGGNIEGKMRHWCACLID
jgi:hypothetical protein